MKKYIFKHWDGQIEIWIYAKSLEDAQERLKKEVSFTGEWEVFLPEA